MGKYIKDSNANTNSTKNVKSVYVSKQMETDVKNKITIPMYFYNIIVPQMGSYYDEYPVDFDQKIVVCCPLHDEDTPSCRYHESTNSFYCFGCQKGGDVTQLHRYFAEKMNGVMPDRDEANAFLYAYFIQGKESETFISNQQVPQEKLNTDAEIVKFNVYRFNLEQSISFDKSLKLEVKQQLWSLLDNIDLLLSLDKIKATEAEQYLKQQVRKLITFDSDIKKIKYKGDN